MIESSTPLSDAFETTLDTTNLDDLVVCPVCDALYAYETVPMGARAGCLRCGAVLAAPRKSAMSKIVMLAATSLVLLTAAVFFPFIEITVGGMTRRSSVLDTALAFSDGLLAPLTLAAAAFIVVLPLIRLAAIIYALAPMSIGWFAPPGAMAAFRLAESLRPWAMAEIFLLGVAVALVKLGGMATVGLGSAFWAMTFLVLINILNDTFMCRLTLWRTLEQRSRS